MLAENFIERQNRLHGTHVTGISPVALGQLLAHNFPGNMRELQNVIERALVLCRSGNIEPEMLPSLTATATSSAGARSPQPVSTPVPPLVYASEADEAVPIQQALHRYRYNRQAAARALGMHRATLYRKMTKYSIELPTVDGRAVGGSPQSAPSAPAGAACSCCGTAPQ